MTVLTGETMRQFIKKFAYKRSWTETQMLIDKLEQVPSAVGYDPHRRLQKVNGALIEVAIHGAFPLIDRIAVALTLADIKKQNTRFRIVNAIFEGDTKES
jgi:hypothetical protein